MRITTDMKEANAVTHAGTFHSDDVFATVVLDAYFQATGRGELVVCRVNDAADAPKDAIVYDIGWGKYDHHQRNGNGIHASGVPYAALGLLWKEFGMTLCRKSTYPSRMWRMVENELIQPIDAVDNGVMPRTEYFVQPCAIPGIISAFNPNWDDKISMDDAFYDAYQIAERIFVKIMERAYSKVAAYDYVYECLMESHKTPGIMVLHTYMPWLDPILKPYPEMAKLTESLRFVVYPANRGGYQWRAIPDREGSFGLRKAAPESWWGLNDAVLAKVCGVENARFCHANGFIGGATDCAGAIEMARRAILA